MVYMTYGVSVAIGIAYPTYKTFKTLESPEPEVHEYGHHYFSRSSTRNGLLIGSATVHLVLLNSSLTRRSHGQHPDGSLLNYQGFQCTTLEKLPS